MWEEQSMGSQTLEIIRQGVWASITGGWFYDPSQNVLCNTFHLYLWLFLLCLPFSCYVYLPSNKFVWYIYCILVAVSLSALKLGNYFLHYIYDTTECITETVEDKDPDNLIIRSNEDIELQDLSKNRPTTTEEGGLGTLLSDIKPRPSSDSLESSVLPPEGVKLNSTKNSNVFIDLEAEVHRKNSTASSGESSEAINQTKLVSPTTIHHQQQNRLNKLQKNRQINNDETMNNKEKEVFDLRIHQSQGKMINNNKRPCLRTVNTEPHSLITTNIIHKGGRRHSNFTNNSLNFLPMPVENVIKPTGSLELGYIDQRLNFEGFYFKPKHRDVRRFRSTALETCCPPPAICANTNSLEIIGCKTNKNPLPPPSTTLTRNQHLNLCRYYGSEIVYPIAEQSDEHQTSHGAEIDDVDSLDDGSDSEFEEANQGSHSPLLFMKYDKIKKVPYSLKSPRLTATEHVLSVDNNSSSNITEPSALVTATDNNYLIEKNNDDIDDGAVGYSTSLQTLKNTEQNYDLSSDCIISSGSSDLSSHHHRHHHNNNIIVGPMSIVRKKNVKKYKRRKSDTSGTSRNEISNTSNTSSLVQLNLDWLFDCDEENNPPVVGNRLIHRKEPLKIDNEWSSATTVSLEQDVSKVLQDDSLGIPTVKSLGAIPKKLQQQQSIPSRELIERKTPKSESEKCKTCSRCKSDPERLKSLKENKLTQTNRLLRNSRSSSFEEIVDSTEIATISSSRITETSSNDHQNRDLFKNLQSKSEEASSSGSNNELSTLLPPAAPPLLSALLVPRRDIIPNITWNSENSPRTSQRNRIRRARSGVKRSNNNNNNNNNNAKRENAIAETLTSAHGTHTARNFNDTTDGAVHCFLDEYGNWITYTFDDNNKIVHNEKTKNLERIKQYQGKRISDLENYNNKVNNNRINSWDSNDSIDGVSALGIGTKNDNRASTDQESVQLRENKLETQENPSRTTFRHAQNWDAAPQRRRHNNNNNNNINPNHHQADITLSDLRDLATAANPDNPEIIMLGNRFGVNGTPTRTQLRFIKVSSQENRIRSKNYYKIKLLPWKVTLDRLGLLAMLDRNLTLSETLLSILLTIIVSILGASLLYLDFYKDIMAFIFCFIIASSQYSLLKSVQPDAASPTHGFNRIIAYSRPIYFCIFSILVIICHFNITDDDSSNHHQKTILIATRDFLRIFILFFPVLFSFGLFPQINTFLMYFLEQIDIHVFGGNAMSNLIGSFYCVFRSILAVIILDGLAYGGLSEEKNSQHILFSIFIACSISTSYHLSRSASDPTFVFNLLKKHLWLPELQQRDHHGKEDEFPKNETNNKEHSTVVKEEHIDPLPKKLQDTVNGRLKNDLILCLVIAILVFALHASTVFTVLQPELCPVLWSISAVIGFILHYVMPQLRKHMPWMCVAKPVLRSHELFQFQTREPAKIMWFETVYVYLSFFERNVLFPLLIMSVLTKESPLVTAKYGLFHGSLMVVISGLKFIRNSYSNQNCQYLIVTFTALAANYDLRYLEETFLIMYFFISIVYFKVDELLLKTQFVITYIAPWQITWGSAFHAFAQPFSVPHSAMLFSQAILSALFSSPLNPFLGSAIFFSSYVRPIKFWERDYNTRRVDHSNTSLSSHLDRNLGADDNNLNSIFYEHLTRSLQHSLYGDLAMGRWGNVSQGDVFVMASDYLNCLVHIIEFGNGLVTFQMRGLEFRGTYCQQREVEAITEGVEENEGFLCCDPGHLPNILSLNAAFGQRWLAWEVTASKYILEGYSISDNSVVSMLQVFEFRKVLVSYYVKSIIFYTIRSPKLEDWLSSDIINKALRQIWKPTFVDLDPVFNYNIDEDYDIQHNGMTKNMFMHIHGEWIHYCLEKRGNISKKQRVILLCFALTLLGRRTLGAVSQNMVSSVEFFLYGLHALFKGDFRITCARDEWVFTDMDLLKTVVAPAVRMSLKLHQDHFMTPDEYEILPSLYDAICKHEEELVISHEGDPAWRNAILSGTPSLLALRHVFDEGTDEYKIIMLNKRYLSFRIIKVNRECVRGLWAGQQQELVYLRNRNPERGSIQNAKQALRNIINSSCDQPIGYPIYVSPLTTSYADTNEQYCSLIGGSVTLKKIRNFLLDVFRRIRKRCIEGCSSGASNREEISMGHEGVYAMTPLSAFPAVPRRSTDSFRSAAAESIGRGSSSLSRTSLSANRGSLVSVQGGGKPTSSTLVSLSGLFKEKERETTNQSESNRNSGGVVESQHQQSEDSPSEEFLGSRVKILDPNLVYDCINLGRRIDVSWPTEYMRCRGGRSYWKDWIPEIGMEGPVVHKWTPCHHDSNKRSHVDRTILLVQIDDKFIPIAESGVQDLGPEV